MNTIAQNTPDVQMAGTISNFMKRYKICELLKACNAYKEKGISVVKLFIYMLQMVFANRSMYMQMKTGRWTEGFCKNTYYRFLNSMKVNWERFCLLLSEAIIHKTIEPLTGKNRENVFIVDDTLYRRYGYKKTELSAAVFDHVDMKTRRGFRGLTLGWSDGNTFIPVAHRLLSSPNADKVLGPQKEIDGRTLAGRRRQQARRKATVVMVELLKDALKAGIKAGYVLFDSWFAAPKGITAIKQELGLDVIAMLKKSGKVFYAYNGQQLDVKKIYSMNRKRRGRSKYLLSVEVSLLQKKNGSVVSSVPARIVYVRNTANRKDWVAIISTDMVLSEEEIIQCYGARWNIEVYFKTCKQYLKMLKECNSPSFDAFTCHLAIVAVRYMILSVRHRESTDDRTIGELFWLFTAEVTEISFDRSLWLILSVLLETVQAFFHMSDSQMEEFVAGFMSRLPEQIRESLQPNLLGNIAA